MSRHTLRNDDEYEVVVGYDDPLDTFFAQVIDVRAGIADGEDVLIVQTGMNPQEVIDVADCLASVTNYLPVERFGPGLDSDEIGVSLERERANRRQPTQFQRDTAKRLGGVDLP